MNIEINFTSHVPIYVQLTDQIKRKISSGELKPGDQLPTVRQLAADLRVNFNTVARAYRILDEENIISTQHGRGTFILEPISEKATKDQRDKDLARLAEYFLVETNRLGANPEEIEVLIKKKLEKWKKDGSPPTPEK